jgi:hypothetical protein
MGAGLDMLAGMFNHQNPSPRGQIYSVLLQRGQAADIDRSAIS